MPVDFSGAEFDVKKTSFSIARFQQNIHFVGTIFYQQANFGGTIFEKRTDYSQAVFHETAYFSCATISGECKFDGKGAEGTFLSDCDFTEIKFGERGKLIFEKVNLSKASFLDTDLTNVVFRDVTWYKPPKDKWYKLLFKPKRECALWDEFKPLKKDEQRDYSKIAENYSQLVINYEKKRDFPTAEQFHIGEMECRRKQIGGFNEYSLYKWLSNYGTSYWQAFFVLIFMLFAATGVFLISGFKVVEGRTINYNWGWGIASWVDIKEAFRFTLSILPFQRGMHYEPYVLWTEIWKVVAVLVFSSQFALVLLAVRRRFKR